MKSVQRDWFYGLSDRQPGRELRQLIWELEERLVCHRLPRQRFLDGPFVSDRPHGPASWSATHKISRQCTRTSRQVVRS